MKDLTRVLIKPRITEKSTNSIEFSHAYVFDIDPRATKKDVREAVESIYKITPVKVRVTKVPSKKIFRRGKWGVKSGGKKAYIYLKKGDKIEFV